MNNNNKLKGIKEIPPSSSFHSWIIGLSPAKKRIGIAVLLLIAVGLFILGNIFVFRLGKRNAPNIPKDLLTLINSPTVTPTPYPINRHGKLSFTVASGKKTGPQFEKGFVDPYDVGKDKPQLISLTLTNSVPITSIEVTWATDTKQTTVPLQLVEGTSISGRWEGVWVCDDTYLYKLTISALASDGTDMNKIDITLR